MIWPVSCILKMRWFNTNMALQPSDVVFIAFVLWLAWEALYGDGGDGGGGSRRRGRAPVPA
jgi:hypothetical protein